VINQVEGQAPLGLVVDGPGYARGRAAIRILRPLLWQKQRPFHGQTRRRGGVMQADRHLAVGDFAQRPRVLPRHADGMLALLGKTGLIHDPQARAQFRTQHARQSLADRLIGPRTLADEMLQRLDIPVGQPLGHGLNGLALTLKQQSAHVGLRPRVAIRAAQIREDGCHVINETLAKGGIGEGRRSDHRRHPLQRRLLRREVRRMLRSLPPFHLPGQNPASNVTL
jgi:hypothetical protein